MEVKEDNATARRVVRATDCFLNGKRFDLHNYLQQPTIQQGPKALAICCSEQNHRVLEPQSCTATQTQSEQESIRSDND